MYFTRRTRLFSSVFHLLFYLSKTVANKNIYVSFNIFFRHTSWRIDNTRTSSSTLGGIITEQDNLQRKFMISDEEMRLSSQREYILSKVVFLACWHTTATIWSCTVGSPWLPSIDFQQREGCILHLVSSSAICKFHRSVVPPHAYYQVEYVS